jgi:hypothetical protein
MQVLSAAKDCFCRSNGGLHSVHDAGRPVAKQEYTEVTHDELTKQGFFGLSNHYCF